MVWVRLLFLLLACSCCCCCTSFRFLERFSFRGAVIICSVLLCLRLRKPAPLRLQSSTSGRNTSSRVEPPHLVRSHVSKIAYRMRSFSSIILINNVIFSKRENKKLEGKALQMNDWGLLNVADISGSFYASDNPADASDNIPPIAKSVIHLTSMSLRSGGKCLLESLFHEIHNCSSVLEKAYSFRSSVAVASLTSHSSSDYCCERSNLNGGNEVDVGCNWTVPLVENFVELAALTSPEFVLNLTADLKLAFENGLLFGGDYEAVFTLLMKLRKFGGTNEVDALLCQISLFSRSIRLIAQCMLIADDDAICEVNTALIANSSRAEKRVRLIPVKFSGALQTFFNQGSLFVASRGEIFRFDVKGYFGTRIRLAEKFAVGLEVASFAVCNSGIFFATRNRHQISLRCFSNGETSTIKSLTLPERCATCVDDFGQLLVVAFDARQTAVQADVAIVLRKSAPLFGTKSLLFHFGHEVVVGKFGLKLDSEPFTVELWCYPCNVDEPQILFAHGRKSVEEVLVELLPSDNGVILRGGSRSPAIGASYVTLEFPGKSLQRVWTHIALTFSGATWTLHINGSSKTAAVARLGEAPGVPEGSCSLGKKFVGHLADVRVWATARSKFEIARDFCSPLRGDEPFLKGYFPLFEAHGHVVCDWSPSKGHAFVANPTFASVTHHPLQGAVITHYDPTDYQASFMNKHAVATTAATKGSRLSLCFAFETFSTVIEFDRRCGMQIREMEFPNKLLSVCYEEANVLCFEIGKDGAASYFDAGGSGALVIGQGTVWALGAKVLEAQRYSHWHEQDNRELLRCHDCVTFLELALKAHRKGDQSMLASSLRIVADILMSTSTEEAKSVFGEPLSDASLISSGESTPSTPRELLEWATLLDSSSSLASASVAILLTEKAMMVLIQKASARMRNSTEERLFVGCVKRYSSPLRTQRLLAEKSDKLLQLCSSLVAECHFQLSSSWGGCNAQDCTCIMCLELVQETLLGRVIQKDESPSTIVAVTTYINQILKQAEKAATQFVSLCRKEHANIALLGGHLTSSYIYSLLPSIVTVLPMLPLTVTSSLVAGITTCREAFSTAAHVAADIPFLEEAWKSLVFCAGSIASKLIHSRHTAEAGSNSPYFQTLFMGGIRRSGTPRDAAVRNLLQGVGVISRIIGEMQQEDMPLRVGDSTFLQVERMLVACFANFLLDTSALTSPTKEPLMPVYGVVKSLRQWLLSGRQERESFFSQLEGKLVFLCKFEPCTLPGRGTPLAPEFHATTSTNPQKKWRRMFQAWKAMRSTKAMLAMLSNRSSLTKKDVVTTIISFLKDEDVNCVEIDAITQSRTVKAQHRVIGLSCLRNLVEESKVSRNVAAIIYQTVRKTFCNFHYMNGVEGGSTEALVRLQGSMFQLIDEVFSFCCTDPHDGVWDEVLLSMLASSWGAGDFQRIRFDVPRWLLQLCERGREDAGIGEGVVNHDMRVDLVLQQGDCGGSMTVGATTKTLRGNGARGTYLCPLTWSRSDTSTKYFEVTIVELTPSTTVGIGLGPPSYNMSRPPGWDVGSYALHSDDGVLFVESSNGRQTGCSFGVRDTVGCGWNDKGEIYWTKNGKKLYNVSVETSATKLSPLVGIDGRGIVRVNFGWESTEYQLPLPEGKSLLERSLPVKAWDVVRAFVLHAVHAAVSSNVGEGAISKSPVAQQFFDALVPLTRRISEPASEKFSIEVMRFATFLASTLPSSGQYDVVELCESILEQLSMTTSTKVKCQMLRCLFALSHFVPCNKSDLMLRTFVPTMVRIAAFDENNAPGFCSPRSESCWTNEVALTAFRLLQDMNENGTHNWTSELHRVVLHSLGNAARNGTSNILTILGLMGGIRPPFLIEDDSVEVKLIRATGSGILRSFSLTEEVCEVFVVEQSAVQFFGVKAVTPLKTKMNFPNVDVAHHAAQMDALTHFAAQYWNSSQPESDNFNVDARILEILHSASEVKWHLPLECLRFLTPFVTLQRQTDHSLTLLRDELLVVTAMFSHRTTDVVLVDDRKPDERGTTEAADNPRLDNSDLPAAEMIDEARTRMAQELSMRGFSLEMCMIALEETHYDRSAALRLLTDHHEDLMQVLHQEGEEMSETDPDHSEDDEAEQSEEDGEERNESESDLSCRSVESNMSQTTHDGIRFDGMGSVKISSEVSVGPQFTIDFWIRPKDLSEPQLLFTQRGSGEASLFVFLRSTTLYFGWGVLLSLEHSGVCEVTLGDSDPSRWTRITCVQDCADLSLYKNGILKDSAVAPVAEGLLSSDLMLGGAVPSDSFGGFVGDVRDIRIFETSLAQDVVEGMFSLTQAPTPAATSSHLVIHLRCDDGQFPLENSSISPNSIPVVTTTIGTVSWLPTEVETIDPSIVTQAEIDFTSHSDHEDVNVLDLTFELTGMVALWKQYRGASTDELRSRLLVLNRDIVAHLSCRIALLHIVSAPSEFLQECLQISHVKALTTFAIQCGEEDMSATLMQCMQNTLSRASLSLFDAVVQQLLHLVQTPQKMASFESAHPCKALTETPREVSFPNQQWYSIYLDQRCSASTMLLTIYTDHTLGTVAGQYSAGSLSPFRIRAPKFFFDVRMDGMGPQWGYKLYVVYEDSVQLAAARALRSLMVHLMTTKVQLPRVLCERLTLDALTQAASVNTGKCRRLVITTLTDILKCAALHITALPDPRRLQELRRMAEKQYRREVGLHLHSRFVQVVSEYFVAFKDVESVLMTAKDDAAVSPEAIEGNFTSKRSEQKRFYSSKYRDGKDRVSVEKMRFPEHLRVELNADKCIAVWSERSGASFVANVAIYAGKWYFEARIVATGDVSIGLINSQFDRAATSAYSETQISWGYNGKHDIVSVDENERSASNSNVRPWKAKDVIGVVVDTDARVVEYHVNGCFASAMPYAQEQHQAADSSSGREEDEGRTNVGYFPHFILAADEGVVLNFGGTHFDFDIPNGCLPLDPANLSLGTLIPFNHLRAFEDVLSTFVEDAAPLPPYFVDESDPFEHPLHRQGPPHVSIVGSDETMFVNILDVKNVGTEFRTVRADCVVFAGRWYYEITLATQGLMQLGWLTPQDNSQCTVGDTPYSFAVDGFRRLKWHNAQPTAVSLARRWVAGDVIGCAVDIESLRMVFSLNGRNFADFVIPATVASDGGRPRGFVPAASLRAGNGVTFNFGSNHLRFKPDGFSALGVPDTWHERVDTYYSTLSGPATLRRLETVRSAYSVALSRDAPLSVFTQSLIETVKTIDKLSATSGKSFLQLAVDQVRQAFQAPSPSAAPSSGSLALFEHLKAFSRVAQTAVPLINLSRQDKNIATTMLLASRSFLFATVRDQMVTQILKETNSRSEHFRLTVNRNKSRGKNVNIEDTVFGQTHALLHDQGSRIFKTNKRMWSVLFLGEGAEDVGGPYREHLSEMCAELCSSALPLFIPSANNAHNTGTHRESLVPNPSATRPLHLSMYVFLGRLMGGAMRGGEPLNLMFPPLFWKLLLQEHVSHVDLDCVDRMCLQCIRELQNMKEQYGSDDSGKELFNETFETEVFATQLTDGTVVELVPNGSKVPLTFERANEYIDLLSSTRLKESLLQISKIREGFVSVIPELALSLLTASELEFKVCGLPDYTTAMLREQTTYEGITSEDRRVSFLWQALDAATANQRRLFLKFVSGRERMPVKLRVLPMVTQGDPNQALPRAATCFFAVELPDYTTLDVLKEKLFYAIENCLDIDTDYRARDIDEHDGPQLMVGAESRHEDVDSNPTTD